MTVPKKPNMPLLSFGKHVASTPEIRPLYNISIMFDVPCGSYVIGDKGQAVINGGLARITGVGGLPNTYKSTVADFMGLSVMDHYWTTSSVNLDSEMSKSEARQLALAQRFPNLKDGEFLLNGRLISSDCSVVTLDEFFDQVKEYCSDKCKLPKKDLMATLPMQTIRGNQVQVMRNSTAMIDSLSRANIKAVDQKFNDNAVGHSDNNTEALRINNAKNQFMIQLPTLAERNNLSWIMTAHVDENLALDPRSPPKTKLSFLGNKMKFKYVPGQFLYLTNNLWYCYYARPFLDNNKKPQYPMNESDVNTDLMEIHLQNLRGKYGVSGIPMTLAASQSEGVLIALSEFDYIRQFKGFSGKEWPMGFGISGHDRSYYLDLLPDVKLSRTTVRRKIDENPELRRALELTCELLLIYQYHKLKPEYMCLPAALYEDIQAKGYKWEDLFKTRYKWSYVEDEKYNELPQMTAMDLLRMRVGTYHPYWMAKNTKPTGTETESSLPITGSAITAMQIEDKPEKEEK